MRSKINFLEQITQVLHVLANFTKKDSIRIILSASILMIASTLSLAQTSSTTDLSDLLKDPTSNRSGLSSPIYPVDKNSERSAKFGLSLFNDNADSIDIPDPEDAFKVSTTLVDERTLLVRFDILDCCYLYQKQMSFSSDDKVAFGEPIFSQGKMYTDQFFGETIIHRKNVDITLPITDNAVKADSFELNVGYQGCSDAGVCYPPQQKTITLNMPGAQTSILAASPSPDISNLYVSEQDQLTSRLAKTGIMALPLFFALGVLLAFTPCVFPMVPILSGIITADKNTSQRKAFLLSTAYVISMAATYALFGVLAAATGANLQVAFQHPAVLIAFSALFVVLALSMFGFFELQVPVWLQQKLTATSNQQQSGRFIAASVMGVLSALIVGPCVAAPLIGVLSYITMTGDLLLGGLTLFVLGLGMGFPLLIIGTSAGRLLPKAGPWMNTIKAVFGVGLLAVAIWMLERVMAPAITMSLWAALALSVAAFLRVGRQIERRPLPLLGHALGLALTTYGVLIIIGIASGATDPLRPLQTLSLRFAGTSSVASHPVFVPVETNEELNDLIAQSGQLNKPLMLDFYADWCVSCKEMEKFTFSDPTVAAMMEKFTLVQADVTKNNENDKALLTRFGLYGPPAIIFFQPDGKEAKSFRVTGYMKADPFVSVLSQVLNKSQPILSLRRP